MKKHLSVLACILLSIVSLHAESPIKIGVQVALSGDLATAGEDVKNGALFALEEIGKDKYQLVIEDDKCSAPEAVRVATKLISVDKVKYVIGPVCNGALLPTSPLYARTGVTVISTWATSGDVHDIGKGIFRLFPSDALTARKLYQYVSAHHSKVGLLTELEEYTALVDRSLKKLGNEHERKVSFIDQEVTVGTLDYRAVLTRILNQKPEAIILNAYSEPTVGAMARQLRQMNKDIPIYCLFYPSSENFRKEYSDVAEGMIYADAADASEIISESGKKLFEKFREKFGAPKGSPYLWALGYEAFRAFDEALKSKEDPVQYLHTHKLSGGPLQPYSFNKFGESEDIKLQVKKVVDGQIVVLE